MDGRAVLLLKWANRNMSWSEMVCENLNSICTNRDVSFIMPVVYFRLDYRSENEIGLGLISWKNRIFFRDKLLKNNKSTMARHDFVPSNVLLEHRFSFVAYIASFSFICQSQNNVTIASIGLHYENQSILTILFLTSAYFTQNKAKWHHTWCRLPTLCLKARVLKS